MFLNLKAVRLVAGYYVKHSNLKTFKHLTAASMSSIKIGTHNGTFHCDEALACYMLKLLPEYKDASIVR